MVDTNNNELAYKHLLTFRGLAENIIELTGSKSELIFQPLSGDEPKQHRPDITLAREKLGWDPHIQLREALQKTIAHFAELLNS